MIRIHSFAPGKIILFGEHAVVYGKPAISLAINSGSNCIIESQNQPEIEFKLNNSIQWRFSSIGSISKDFSSQFPQLTAGFSKLVQLSSNDLNAVQISLDSDLWPGTGLGSSASISTAFFYGMCRYFEIKSSLNEINDYVFQMEKAIHGNPSGIDNSTCVFGGILRFQNKTFVKITGPKDLPILIVNSGFPHNTADVLRKVNLFRQNQPERFDFLLNEIEGITIEGETALKKGDLVSIGYLFQKNQKFLAEMGVSSLELDKIIEKATKGGAWGSKLTGAGQGGCVIILGDLPILSKISNKFSKDGFQNFIIQQNERGVYCPKK